MNDLISRQAAIEALKREEALTRVSGYHRVINAIRDLPSSQPEYRTVTAEDFAKTMSEYTAYKYMAWYGEALALMKEHGFVICKKTM